MSVHFLAPAQSLLSLAIGVVGLVVWGRAAVAQEKPAARASAVEYEGWRQYMVNCARCHGDDAKGGVMAPDLRASIAKGAVDAAAFHATVSAGRREKGMPAFTGVLSDQQMAAIFGYVKARAEERLPAGRPVQ